jgi:GH15 family glucan-1,4-alpha-glucosidase
VTSLADASLRSSARDERYAAIADHGMIGDLQTAALVAVDGRIDFLCLPDFDSPSVFASLLDADRGGYFSISPLGPRTDGEQRYLRDTNVLVTRFASAAMEFEVVDFMPVERRPGPSRIVRLVRVIRGSGTIRVRCVPRFDYGRETPAIDLAAGTALLSGSQGVALRLTSNIPLEQVGGGVGADFDLDAGRGTVFVLEHVDQATRHHAPNPRWGARALRRTIVFWRRWIKRTTYHGDWGAPVRRSALALKLLQSRRTGAIIAAPTFGLPEQIGGARNWDFRYAWIRDSSFAAYSLVRLGATREADAFTRWAMRRCEEADTPGEIQSFYGLSGRRQLSEQTLDHLEGHCGSRPVRIGNAAYDQLQLDIYGELIDALFLRDRHDKATSHEQWRHVAAMTDWVCGNWQRPDQGIWEVRSGSHEFLHSRVMCWVAVDRALRIARRRNFPAPHERWGEVRAAIQRDVLTSFWSNDLGAFVGAKGSTSIDAACLVMPLVGIIAPTDPRWLSTLRVVERRLVRGSLVRRYDMEGMDTDAGSLTAPSFTICSFWYVECLARSGDLGKARAAMTQLLGYANHLGLFSEDLGVDGSQLGNFPQGLVHASLIGAAMSIRDLEGGN